MGGPKSWKGGKSSDGKGSTVEALEAQYTASCSHIYDGLMDLNVASAQLLQPWKELLVLRSRLLQSYGIQSEDALVRAWGQASFPPTQPSAAAKAPAAVGSNGEIDWKSRLYTEVIKRLGKQLMKGEMVFTTFADEEKGGFAASATTTTEGIFVIQDEYIGETAPSKRVAEQNAGKAALMSEFPEAYRSLQKVAPVAAPLAGTKRKAAAKEPEVESPKSRLMQMVQVMIGRSITKGDIVYENTSLGGEGREHLATVRIPAYDENSVWQGEEAASIKLAENSAAAIAVQALEPIVAPMEEEHRAKKAKLIQEKKDMWKFQNDMKHVKVGEAAGVA